MTTYVEQVEATRLFQVVHAGLNGSTPAEVFAVGFGLRLAFHSPEWARCLLEEFKEGISLTDKPFDDMTFDQLVERFPVEVKA